MYQLTMTNANRDVMHSRSKATCMKQLMASRAKHTLGVSYQPMSSYDNVSIPENRDQLYPKYTSLHVRLEYTRR